MFFKSNKQYKILKILFIVFFLFTFLSFILSSIYDLQINKFFAKGMDIYGLKIFVWVYEELGMTQSYLFIFLFISIYLEIKRIENKESKIWNLAIWIFYGAVFVFWFTANLYWIITTTKIDDGYGPGISGWFLDSYKIRQIILIVLFLLETTAMSLVFYYIRFKFVRRSDILSSGYKVDAIKAFSAFLTTSLIVYIMKVVFGRPYFYSVDFENIFYSDRVTDEWKTYWITTGHKIKSWGIYDVEIDRVMGVDYLPWWQINDFFGNFTDIFKPLGTGKAGWWNMDFPSGHMISCFTMLYTAYFFLGEKKNRKLNWKLWSIIGIWFLHINTMQYTQIISRTHWISDTSFSIILSLIVIIFNGKIIDWFRNKNLNKTNTK
ncbi:phosphatase PAP2 family protein [Spiroplasma endosymbiont of Diplazon laetatorius]|uniref:phosphatase PAP2 family protein n=1 Tax=Spiroplasma endosymbiont of Diplazon laetatorius TaxID=3066322 RepID=UPI0030CD8BB8